jgi:hypothetical protein
MIIPGKNYQLSGNRRDRVDPWGCSACFPRQTPPHLPVNTDIPEDPNYQSGQFGVKYGW